MPRSTLATATAIALATVVSPVPAATAAPLERVAAARGVFICESPLRCLTARNTGSGPAARFEAAEGVPPFRVPEGAGRIPHLDASRLGGLKVGQIIRRAVAAGAGGRAPTGAAGGALTGEFPNPSLAANAIDSPALFAGALKDGPVDLPALRSLGTGAQQAAAGDDPRLSDARRPAGPAGGVLTGTFPDPGLADGAVSSLAQFAADLKDGPAGEPALRSLGTGARQAAAGDDPRLSDARTPTGAAGGDLTGSYPDPVLTDGSIDAVTLFGNGLRDGAAGTPTLRSLGTGAQQAAAGTDPRLSNARTPTGAAGGDLTGTYPNPVVGANAIGGAAVADGSLRLGDLIVFGSSFSVSANLAPRSCGTLQADLSGIFDVQDGDILEVYPVVDTNAYGAAIDFRSGTQNGDETVIVYVCNLLDSGQTISGGPLPFAIYRR